MRIARIYDRPNVETGEIPLLVDRLWPRGISRTRVPGLKWMKDWAPSSPLRQWYHTHPEEFAEFRNRYWKELEVGASRILSDLVLIEQETTRHRGPLRLLLLYGARNPERNNAVVLRDYLDATARPRPTP